MKLGIKVGPQAQAIRNLLMARPEFVEVWYNANRPNDYADLFAAIRTTNTQAGLHFWGGIADGSMASISNPEGSVIDESMTIMRQTIDTAAANGYAYVNIHPGPRARVVMDFDTQTFRTLTAPADADLCTPVFVRNALELTAYAKARGVVLTVETVPLRSMDNWMGTAGRDTAVVDIHEMPITAVIAAADAGVAIANDFGHTAAAILSDDRDAIAEFVFRMTDRLFAATRLLHIGFIEPPYNGTDFHDSLDNPVFDTKRSIPDKSEMLALIKTFKPRDDVWALVEPRDDHVGNYKLAADLIAAAR